MNLRMKSIFYSFLFACFFGVKCVFAQQLSPMIGFDLSELTETRDGIKKGESLLIKSYNDLIKEADACLTLKPETVTDGMLPPSGDKHDFYAIGKYAWPNPKSADGIIIRLIELSY